MSPQGRPKGEYRSAQREGFYELAWPSRGEHRSALRERIPMTLPAPDTAAREHSARVVDAIRRDIADAGGWIPFARYMEQALYAPGLATTWRARANSARPAISSPRRK